MQAFGELYERHNRRVYSPCLRVTANIADAEDLSQEVFIQIAEILGCAVGTSKSQLHKARRIVRRLLIGQGLNK